MSKIGHYEIVKELGRGGMGVVLKAHEPSLGRFVAIKVLGDQVVDDANIRARFIREAQSAAKLNHPNIVQVYYVGEEDGKPFFAMEFVDGVNLGDVIASERQLPAERAAGIILQAATGLAKAHELGIVHRDIKPANILINRDGLVKVADFGIAHVTDEKLTGTGNMLGTMGYFSPEVCKGEKLDGRSDLFSLGIVFYEILSGATPFKQDSLVTMVQEVLHTPLPDIRIRNQSADDRITAILERMTAKDRNNRYNDCKALIADLKAFLNGQDVTYVPGGAGAAGAAGAAHEATEVIPGMGADDATVEIATGESTAPYDEPTVRTHVPEEPPPIRKPEPPQATRAATVVAEPPKKKKSMLLPLVAIVALAVMAFAAYKMIGPGEDPIDSPPKEIVEVDPKLDETLPLGGEGEPPNPNEPESKPQEQDKPSIEQPSREREPQEMIDLESNAPGTDRSGQALPPKQGSNQPPTEVAKEEPGQPSATPDSGQTIVLNTQGNNMVSGSPTSVTKTVEVQSGRNTVMNVTADAEEMVRLPDQPKVAVWVEGDKGIANRLQYFLTDLFKGDGYKVIDGDLIDADPGARLVSVGKAAMAAGADILVHAQVDIEGSRSVTSFGRQSTVYSTSATYKTYFPAGGRMVGETYREEFEFTDLNAKQQAESQANQVIDVLIKNIKRVP